MNITTIGIDLAKNTFSLHGADAKGKTVLKKTVSRGKLLEHFANLPPCVVGMEACSGAHHWVRELRALGHDARIIAPRFVTPYRRKGKNDNNEAEAICEASVGLPCALSRSNPANSKPFCACIVSVSRWLANVRRLSTRFAAY